MPREPNLTFRCLLFVALLAFTTDACAYIDPNAPGLLFQLLFPLIVAVTMLRNWLVSTAKRIWSKLGRRKD